MIYRCFLLFWKNTLLNDGHRLHDNRAHLGRKQTHVEPAELGGDMTCGDFVNMLNKSAWKQLKVIGNAKKCYFNDCLWIKPFSLRKSPIKLICIQCLKKNRKQH